MSPPIIIPEGLRYSRDSEPGISRLQKGDHFRYIFDDNAITEPDILDRIKTLGLPPAYSNVWICSDSHGHLQATGFDDKDRKQYCYHADWTAFRAQKKFDQLLGFGEALPAIRRRISRHLKGDSLDKQFVCAALLRLIDRSALRAGNTRHDATGASTLKRKHITIKQNSLHLDYRAKGGKRVRKAVKDRTLARVIQEIDDLPGKDLFQYVSENGEVSNLDSADANSYLRGGFTLKTFRTWHGSVAAFAYALKNPQPTIKAMSEAAAKRLHNTPSICRIGKTYFDFTDEELKEIDKWIRNNQLKRFGPVQEVKKELVFEVAFDSAHESPRHKSGYALRFPRIHRIRWDKPASEADKISAVAALVGG